MDTQTKQRVISSMLQANRPDLANYVAEVTTADFFPPNIIEDIEDLAKKYKGKLGRAKPHYLLFSMARRMAKEFVKKLREMDLASRVELMNTGPGSADVYVYAEAGKVTADAKLSSSLKSKINRDLIKAGLDGNGRFRKVGEAINVASGVFQKHGLEEDDVFSADRLRGPDGRATFNMAFTNVEDPFSPEPISNSMLVVQWHFFEETGQYEVLMYLS